MEFLEGGRTGTILKDGQTVIRPAGPWSPAVHRLLRYLRDNGFKKAPEPISVTEHGQEIVSYLEGRVCEDLADAVAGSHDVLVSAAHCLRAFHDASGGFLEIDELPQTWMLEPRQPCEIVCHGDFAPYNVTLDGISVSGIIDFDTAHPAPRLWDLAYAVYRWAPLSDPANPFVPFDTTTQMNRARAFCLEYGTTADERASLPALILQRLQYLINFMVERARQGDEQFREDMELGHVRGYLNDIAYLERIQNGLLKALEN